MVTQAPNLEGIKIIVLVINYAFMRLSAAYLEIIIHYFFCFTCYMTLKTNIMDSFEINKIVASILLIALLFIGIGKISDLVFHIDKPETAGYKVEMPENGSANQISETKRKP